MNLSQLRAEIERLSKAATVDDACASLVAGVYAERSIADFLRACAVHIEDQQRNQFSDTPMAVLCDAVRFARELARLGPNMDEVRFLRNAVPDLLAALELLGRTAELLKEYHDRSHGAYRKCSPYVGACEAQDAIDEYFAKEKP